MAEIARQRRARRIAMTTQERDGFLRAQRTVRVASLNRDGTPHVTPLWFVWDGEHMWMSSLVTSQRWANFMRDPRVAAVVDSGLGYFELHGVELAGNVEVVGEQPRRGEPNPALDAVERQFSEKYLDGNPFAHDGRHAWVRVIPEREYTWDFRKL